MILTAGNWTSVSAAELCNRRRLLGADFVQSCQKLSRTFFTDVELQSCIEDDLVSNRQGITRLY